MGDYYTLKDLLCCNVQKSIYSWSDASQKIPDGSASIFCDASEHE
jgi:hypothetical protein